MKRLRLYKTYVIVFVIIASFPAYLRSQIFSGEDELIRIEVDSIIRADTYPDRLRSEGFNYGTPAPGNDFAFVFFRLTEKEDLGISSMERRFSGTSIIDQYGNVSRGHSETLYMGSLDDPDSIRSGYLFFTMNRDASPSWLDYYYQYKLPGDRRILIGELRVNFSGSQDWTSPAAGGSAPSVGRFQPITFRKGKCYQGDVYLSRKTVAEIVRYFPIAYQEVKSGRSRITWGYVLGMFGSISIGGGLSTLIVGETSESLDPASGIGVGTTCLVGGILLIRSGATKFVNGVEIYNSKLVGQRTPDGIILELGLADHGFGFMLKF